MVQREGSTRKSRDHGDNRHDGNIGTHICISLATIGRSNRSFSLVQFGYALRWWWWWWAPPCTFPTRSYRRGFRNNECGRADSHYSWAIRTN